MAKKSSYLSARPNILIDFIFIYYKWVIIVLLNEMKDI